MENDMATDTSLANTTLYRPGRICLCSSHNAHIQEVRETLNLIVMKKIIYEPAQKYESCKKKKFQC